MGLKRTRSKCGLEEFWLSVLKNLMDERDKEWGDVMGRHCQWTL